MLGASHGGTAPHRVPACPNPLAHPDFPPHPAPPLPRPACSATGLLEAAGYAALVYTTARSGKGPVFNSYVAMQVRPGGVSDSNEVR